MRHLTYVLALLLLMVPAAAAAQLRYVASVDLRTGVNTNVFAGSPNPAPDRDTWGLNNEVSPALRLYLYRPRMMLSLAYRLTLQFLVLPDAVPGTSTASDPPEFGYGNEAFLAYHYALIPGRTELVLNSQLTQGTENVVVQGPVGPGGYTNPFWAAGFNFISNTAMTTLYHSIDPRWSITPRAIFEFYHVLEWAEPPDTVPPPTTYVVTVTNDLQRYWAIGDLRLTTDFSYVLEQRDQSDLYPPDLTTYLASATLGWHHELTEQWDYRLEAGIGARFRDEIVDGPAGPLASGSFSDAWTPIGGANLRFRWQHWIEANLYYMHRYRTVLESLVNTVSQVDEVGLYAFFIRDPLRLDVGGSFRYMRFDRQLQQQIQSENDATNFWRAEATLTFVVLPWLSLEVSYDLEAATDHVAYISTAGGQAQAAAPTDYARHRVMGGVSVAWPPPPPHDRRLNTRVSSYEPVFTNTGDVAEQRREGPGLVNPDRVEGQQDPLEDLERRERERGAEEVD
jgi:hypothetical protein